MSTQGNTPETDAQRREQALSRVFGKVARNRLQGAKNADYVEPRSIEGDGTRMKRTKRVLEEVNAIREAKIKNVPDWQSHVWEVLTFDGMSPIYGKPNTFAASKVYLDVQAILTNSIVLDRNRYCYARYGETENLTNVRTLEEAGSKNIEDLSNAEAIHIWWHRNDYVFDGNKPWKKGTEYTTVMQKTLKEKANILIGRSIVDAYIKFEMREILAEEVGAKALLNAVRVGFDVPNISHYITFLHPEHIKKTKELYDLLVTCAQNMQRVVESLTKRIEDEGGHSEYLTYMRRKAVKRVLEDAPLHVVKERTDLSFRSFVTNSYEPDFDFQRAAEYVLAHIEDFDFDKLYPKDFEEFLFIEQDENSHVSFYGDSIASGTGSKEHLMVETVSKMF